MHSSKFIQIRKERSVEQRLASIWLDACEELHIPCILIYKSNWHAYISLNLKFLEPELAARLNTEELKEKFMKLQQKYATSSNGYCQHNAQYHTFDAISGADATLAATEIFDTIMPVFDSKNSLLLESAPCSA